MRSIQLIIAIVLLPVSLLAQPYYLFTGKGKDSCSFYDQRNWAKKSSKGILGVPMESEPQSAQYRYSLHIDNAAELRLDLIGPESFTEALNIIGGRLTLMPGYHLSFLNLNKDSGGKKIRNFIQGESTITIHRGASLTFKGNVYVDKFRNMDPVPWILLNDATLNLLGETRFLAGLIKLKGNSFLEAEYIDFGKYQNTGLIDFERGSRSRIRIRKIFFSGEEADYRHLIRSRNILINGNPPE